MKSFPILSLYFTIWMIFQWNFAESHSPYVKTPLSSIKGQWKVSYLGRRYAAYEGIPYAQPPTGDRRFQPPQPIVRQSKNIIDATKDPNVCTQYDYEVSKVVGVEDCLYLNIYVPPYRKSLPVIVWFHEGAFQRGAGTYTKAKYLMDRNVILVTLNYRVGLFGFLSTGDHVVSGNMGLKDQNLALRWVVDNIRYFGGDPKRISLFGASAGSASVHYHYLSKMSAGLFRSGVSFSGTALSLWAYDPTPLRTSQRLAVTVGCTTESSVKMVECLKNLPAESLAGGIRPMLTRVTGSSMFSYPSFAPVAEKNVTDYFINRSPEEILRSGDVYGAPWTTGVVSEEGAEAILSIASNNKRFKYYDSNWDKGAKYLYFFERTLPINKRAAAARAAKQHYIGNRHFDNDEQCIKGLIKMRSDRSFFTIMEKSARLQAKANKGPVYTYLYSYKAAMSGTNYISHPSVNWGPTHLDDVFLVLENDHIDPTTTPSDRAMLKVMLDFWYSAATIGIPKLTVMLPRVNPNKTAFEFLHIAGPNNYYLEGSNNFGDKNFWISLGFDLKA